MVSLRAGITTVVLGLALALALVLATAGAARAADEPGLLPGCAYGADVPGLTGYEQTKVEHDARAYADGLSRVSDAERTDDARTFAAAAAAYVYGLSLVDVHETVKRFEVRNQITSIDALETPANETTVSPNVDTTYTVGWIDLTSGPVVMSVPSTNQELTIDPPPAGDDCALDALAPAGVVLPSPGPEQSLSADYENEVGDPTGSTAASPANAAVTAGTADAVKVIAAASATLNSAAAQANRGWDVLGNWIGNYGQLYLGRAIIATSLLGANIPKQAI